MMSQKPPPWRPPFFLVQVNFVDSYHDVILLTSLQPVPGYIDTQIIEQAYGINMDVYVALPPPHWLCAVPEVEKVIERFKISLYCEGGGVPVNGLHLHTEMIKDGCICLPIIARPIMQCIRCNAFRSPAPTLIPVKHARARVWICNDCYIVHKAVQRHKCPFCSNRTEVAPYFLGRYCSRCTFRSSKRCTWCGVRGKALPPDMWCFVCFPCFVAPT